MKADSPFWRGFRAVLAALASLEPAPKPGEAWCQQCILNEGTTLVMPADLLQDHLTIHVREGGGPVRVIMSRQSP